MLKSGNHIEKNTGKNLVKNFLTPHVIPDTTCLRKLGPLTLCVNLCAAYLTSSLWLVSDEVVLPSAGWKDASPALWHSFPTSRTEDVSPSQQIDVAPKSTSLWLFCVSANALTGFGILPQASLSLPLTHCFDLWLSLATDHCYSANQSAKKSNFWCSWMYSPSPHRSLLIILCWSTNDQD